MVKLPEEGKEVKVVDIEHESLTCVATPDLPPILSMVSPVSELQAERIQESGCYNHEEDYEFDKRSTAIDEGSDDLESDLDMITVINEMEGEGTRRFSITSDSPSSSTHRKENEGSTDGFSIFGSISSGPGSDRRCSQDDSLAGAVVGPSIEDRLNKVAIEILAELLNKKKFKSKNASELVKDKQIKKTLSKLSYDEKAKRDCKLFKEHITEEVRESSIIIYSCKTCQSFPSTINKVSASRHASSHEKSKKRKRGHTRRYECAFCDKVSKTKKEHVLHYQSNHCEDGLQTLSCTKCFKRFSDLSSLTDHIRIVHTVKLELQICTECGKMLRSKRLLRRHMKMVHLESKRLECHFCGKKFRDRYGLKRHEEKVHSLEANGLGGKLMEKPSGDKVKCSSKERANCPLCDKEVLKLNWHLKLTHGVDKNLKPTFSRYKHTCTGCGKPFRDKCNLERHLPSCQRKELKENNRCNMCDKAFSSKKSKKYISEKCTQLLNCVLNAKFNSRTKVIIICTFLASSHANVAKNLLHFPSMIDTLKYVKKQKLLKVV